MLSVPAGGVERPGKLQPLSFGHFCSLYPDGQRITIKEIVHLV